MPSPSASVARPNVAQAEKSSLVNSIAETVAKGALDQITGQAMNAVLSFAGFDLNGDGAISTKLDEILAKLDQITATLANIQASIDNVMRKMQKGQSQIDYDLNVKPLQNLIDKNASLLAAYRTLAQVSGAEADQARATIAGLRDSAFLQSLETWNDALCGLSSQTGLIAAWNSRVRYFYAPLFEPASAKDIQDHWDLFDSQQALSVNFLVHYYYDTNQPTQARATLATWLKNRNQQLTLLRGGTRQEDTAYIFDPATCQLTQSTQTLKAFPPMLICHLLDNQWWLWGLRVDAAYLQGLQEPGGSWTYPGTVFSWANQDNGLQLSWSYVTTPIAAAFLKACGGQLGIGYGDLYTQEHWKSALTAKGFIFPAGRAGDFLYSIARQGTVQTHDQGCYTWEIFGEAASRSQYGQWDPNWDNLDWYLSKYGRRGNPPAGIAAVTTVGPEMMAKYLYD
jgi:hypothetical protein